ncbi:hypothetical protein ANTQUA_LOCUS2180 [Anthophora quadrimaculata]
MAYLLVRSILRTIGLIGNRECDEEHARQILRLILIGPLCWCHDCAQTLRGRKRTNYHGTVHNNSSVVCSKNRRYERRMRLPYEEEE